MSLKNGVLEGSRLDFGGPGPRFWRVLGRFFRDFRQKQPQTTKTCQERTSITDLPDRQRWVGGGDPPRGVSIRRPPKVCEACWTTITIACQIRQDQSRRANLKGQAPYASLGSCSPLFFSPQEAGDHRNPPLNLRVLRLVGCLGLIFCSSETLFKNDIEKTSRKV